MSLSTGLLYLVLCRVIILFYSTSLLYVNNEHACNVPKERSNVSGTATVLPHLFVPTTTLDHHMQAEITLTMDHLLCVSLFIRIHKLLPTHY